MPFGTYCEKVRHQTCPVCGRSRPIDWFKRNGRICEEAIPCWSCRYTPEGKRFMKRKEQGNELIG